MRKLFSLVVLVVAGISASAQSGVTGTVSSVLDGRTLVLETNGGRMTAQLQYVEVPASGEPMFDVSMFHVAISQNSRPAKSSN
jgi:hypothetical protein